MDSKIILQLSSLQDIFKKYNVSRKYLVGSYARGDQNSQSDIDIFIVSRKGLTFSDYMNLKFELEKELGKKVDILMKNNLKTGIYEYIKKDFVKI